MERVNVRDVWEVSVTVDGTQKVIPALIFLRFKIADTNKYLVVPDVNGGALSIHIACHNFATHQMFAISEEDIKSDAIYFGRLMHKEFNMISDMLLTCASFVAHDNRITLKICLDDKLVSSTDFPESSEY